MCEVLSQFLGEIKFALLLDPHTYFIKTVGEFVCIVCGKQFMAKNAMTTTGVSTLNEVIDIWIFVMII